METRYTVIVFAGIDIETTQAHVIVAFRAKHTHIEGLSSSEPKTVLRAFLDEFGVDVTLAGLRTSDLFLGGQLSLPKTITTGAEAMQFLGMLVREDQIAESFAMAVSLGDIVRESDRHFAPVNVLLFYATEHYAKSISEHRSKRDLPERSLAPFRRRRAAIRAEYESRIKNIGYTPPKLDSDERREHYEEAQRVGLAGLYGVGLSDVHSYQEVLDRVSKSVESFVRARSLDLPQAVFVGEWPFGELQATVERIATGHGMLVLVNRGLIAFVYHFAKIFTNSLSLFRLDDQSSVGDLIGLPASNWTMENTVDALSEALAAYVAEGHVGAAPRIPLKDVRRAMFGLAIATWAESFVVAHEYGHVLAEDLGPSCAVGTPKAEPIGESQRRESQADLTALNLCLATANWSKGGGGLVDANVRVAGACLFFVVGLFIDATIKGPHDFTANEPGTHPVPYFRLKTIMEHITRYYDESPLCGTTRKRSDSRVRPRLKCVRSITERASERSDDAGINNSTEPRRFRN
ncbi:MAG: hypothetical protein HYV60_19175 [Planctomycetia bacterium]|nr:hypothetical protein [Planctomycetia bacterium]